MWGAIRAWWRQWRLASNGLPTDHMRAVQRWQDEIAAALDSLRAEAALHTRQVRPQHVPAAEGAGGGTAVPDGRDEGPLHGARGRHTSEPTD